MVASWSVIKHAHGGITRVAALVRILFLVPFVAAGIFALVMFGNAVSWSVIIFLVFVVAINIVFLSIAQSADYVGPQIAG